ncbi:hypothetical protein NLI96_g11346 [Meripilus lineatus]|uniref:Uncharacterized protein n=1 Tax=Meripilus lineatus TaxID=2056292 RepID=A0AAD5URX8_9APHY|nr:hypothetical protein NLI96_g11346 [Physisporinus lineatus]
MMQKTVLLIFALVALFKVAFAAPLVGYYSVSAGPSPDRMRGFSVVFNDKNPRGYDEYIYAREAPLGSHRSYERFFDEETHLYRRAYLAHRRNVWNMGSSITNMHTGVSSVGGTGGGHHPILNKILNALGLPGAL